MSINYLLIIKYVLLSLSIIVPIILAIAMFTLLERKVLAAIQRRRGPNMVGFWGFLQPFADAFKSIFKEISIPSGCDYYFFLFSPIITLVLSLMSWSVIPFSSCYVFADINLGVLFVLLVSSFNVYGIVLAGWSSNSKYALIGSIRSAAQIISYEIPLTLSIAPVIMASGSLNLTEIVFKQYTVWYVFMFFPCFLIFFVCMLAETNRTPFDLPEAEAEIVAGYNVEYSSIFFAMFFLAEYGNIMVMSSFAVILFFGGWSIFFDLSLYFSGYNLLIIESFIFILKVVIFMLLFILVRAVLPRYRYDQLMEINWKLFLPLSLSFIIFYAAFYIIFLRII